jgi:hypothetical protein
LVFEKEYWNVQAFKKSGNAEFNEYPYENIRISVLFRKEYRIELAFKIGNVGFNKYP